jgi:hypothetical protein
MRPELRSIFAPMLALVAVSVLVVYISSCSGSQKDAEAPPAAAEKGADGSEDAKDGDAEKAIPAERFADALPSEKELLDAARPKRQASAKHPSGEDAGRSVAQVLDDGCSTKIVMGLSEQIIAEGNCIQPGAYAKVPSMKNVELGGAVFPYMTTGARDALVDAAAYGKRYDLKINSMLRTVAQQYLLYDWYKRGRCGIKLAATPGRSNHQSGLAVDIANPGTWKKIMRKHGFRWLGKKDRWHFDFDGEKAKRGLDIKAFQRLWNRNHPDDEIRADGDWGETTERALRAAPADGFPIGATCRFGDND